MEILKYIQEFENELHRKFYRKNSIKTYVDCVSIFLKYFDGEKKEPKAINESDIKKYLCKFKEQNTQRSHHSAIKCFYKYVLKQRNKFKYIEYAKRNRKLPIVHSVDEMQKIISACTNIKHKCIIGLLYGCGLRVGEVINLKISNIDSSRMVINIIDAKGGKDRQVMLPQNLLELLRKYFFVWEIIYFWNINIKKMKLSENQQQAIKWMQTYLNDMVMFNGWMTGGHGVKIKLNTVRSLEKLGLIKKGKLTDKAKQIFS